MSLLAKESEGTFTPVSAGTKAARCFGVIDLGTQASNNPKYRPSRKVLLQWEIPEETYEFENKQIPMTIMKEYSLTLGKANKESKLRTDLNSWRGRPFTEQEASGFDLKNLLNVPCYLSINHYKKNNGDPGAKVGAIMGVPKGVVVPELSRAVVFYEIAMKKGKEFEALPEWIRKKINTCLEWSPTDEHVPVSTVQEEEQPSDDEVPF